MSTIHWVVCLYCGERFNRDEIDCIKVGRRYAHIKCAEEHEANMTQEERDYESLQEYCKKLFGEDYNYIGTKRLIEKYKKDYGYTYSGIEKSLRYFYEIKGNSVEKANGSIGIIPYTYEESRKYYYNLYLVEEKNKDYVKENIPAKEVNIASPRQRIKIKKMWFEDEDTGEIKI